MVQSYYLDTNLFITAALDESENGKKARQLLNKIHKGETEGYTATLTVDEFLWKLQKDLGKERAIEAVRIFWAISHLTLISIDTIVIKKALDVYKEMLLDPRDSIHIAAMQIKGITIIISTDRDFDKIKGIKRIDFTK